MITFKSPPPSVVTRRYGTALPARRRSAQRSHVINEPLFRDALIRERKRADRFEEAFAVLLIAFDRDRVTPAAVSRLAESLSQSPPAADVVGWFEQDSVLGLIRSTAAGDAAVAAAALTNAVRRAIARCLPADLAPEPRRPCRHGSQPKVRVLLQPPSRPPLAALEIDRSFREIQKVQRSVRC